MEYKRKSAIVEKILVVYPKEKLSDCSEQKLETFTSFCKTQDIEYEKQIRWNLDVELDRKSQIPKFKDGSGPTTEHIFKKNGPKSDSTPAYVFRICPECIIFNWLEYSNEETTPLDGVIRTFIPFWEKFKEIFEINQIERIQLDYLLKFNTSSIKDKQLFCSDGWVEVRDISVLFASIPKMKNEQCYIHPFQTIQHWKVNPSPFSEPIVLSCAAKSIKGNNDITIRFQLGASVYNPNSTNLEKQWIVLFDALSNLYNVIFTDSLKNAIEGDWE